MSEQKNKIDQHTIVGLNNGTSIPILGYGTHKAEPGEIGSAVKKALAVGYRHIDCAACYDNEKEIGDALKEVFKEGKIKREDVFITSKLWCARMHPDEIKPALKKTLSDLQLDYLDLFLVHIPVNANIDMVNFHHTLRRTGYGLQDVWRNMEKLYEEGLAKSIGVSNYTAVLIADMLSYAKVLPVLNQVERHPYLVQEKLVKACQENDIQITAYAPLGALYNSKDANVLDDEVIKQIAKSHNKTPAQVLIRWQLDNNVITIPKSVKPQRIEENFNVWDFQLSSEEIKKINDLDKKQRGFHQDWMGFPLFV